MNEWRKNPQWSFSCCLALVLPLIALPGEISSLSKTNILRTQLDSGQMELGTLTDAVKNCGVIEVTLGEDEDKEEDEEEGTGGTQEQQDNPSGNQCNKERKDQGVQTAILSVLIIADHTNYDRVEDTCF